MHVISAEINPMDLLVSRLYEAYGKSERPYGPRGRPGNLAAGYVTRRRIDDSYPGLKRSMENLRKALGANSIGSCDISAMNSNAPPIPEWFLEIVKKDLVELEEDEDELGCLAIYPKRLPNKVDRFDLLTVSVPIKDPTNPGLGVYVEFHAKKRTFLFEDYEDEGGSSFDHPLFAGLHEIASEFGFKIKRI